MSILSSSFRFLSSSMSSLEEVSFVIEIVGSSINGEAGEVATAAILFDWLLDLEIFFFSKIRGYIFYKSKDWFLKRKRAVLGEKTLMKK